MMKGICIYVSVNQLVYYCTQVIETYMYTRTNTTNSSATQQTSHSEPGNHVLGKDMCILRYLSYVHAPYLAKLEKVYSTFL